MLWKSLVPLCLCAVLIAGCASDGSRAKQEAAAAAAQPPKPEPSASEKIAATPGAPRIKISLGEQRAYFYKGDKMVVSTRISSGKKSHPTPKGSFKITERDSDHVSNAYGKIVDADGTVVNKDADSRKDPVPEGGKFVGAPMPYFLRFNGGVGMHAGNVPNYPASHACVRLPRSMAKAFFEHTRVGTPVVVTD